MPELKPEIITSAEGEALGQEYLQSLRKCFAANDFSSQYAMMADNVSWEWSGDVIGKGTKDEYYDVLAKTWQPLVSTFLPSNVNIAVDTVHGIITIAFECVLNLDGRGAVPTSTTSMFQGKNNFELRVNKEKKIIHFGGLWDPQKPELTAAIGAVMKVKQPQAQHPAPKPQIISEKEGEAVGAKFIASLKRCFAANDFSSQHAMMASTVAWDWSDDKKGSGPKSEFYEVLEKSWQPLVSQFIPSNQMFIVDTVRGIITCSFDILLKIDGRGAVPTSSTSLVNFYNLFQITVNKQHKITLFRGLWEPQHAGLMKAVGDVLKAKAGKAKTGARSTRAHGKSSSSTTGRVASRRRVSSGAKKPRAPTGA